MRPPRFRALSTAAVALALVAAPSAGQEPDSLLARLQRAEEAIERLQHQLEEQSQSKVQSRLRNLVTLSGLVLVNGFYTGARVNNSDVPTFVRLDQDTTTGLPNSHIAGTLRQSRLGFTVTGARVLGGALTADLQADFFGGQQPSSGARTHPLMRVRTATARIDWPHFGLLIGQEMPLISPNNPVSFASSGLPGYTAAGNLWLWIPQLRASVETGGSFRLGVQSSVLAPMQPNFQPAFLTEPDSAERSGRPTVQGRLYVGWGDDESESQFGVGVHRGWIATGTDTMITSKAITADWRLALGERVLIHGEAFFNAQAVAGLGAGGIGQNLGPNAVPVRTRGGWAQVNLRPTFAWELGGGAGVDDPDEADLAASGRLKNVVYTGHLHWRPGGGLLVGVEFRRLETTYQAGTIAAHHVNGFVGVVF